MTDIDYGAFPWIPTHEFDLATVDVTKWEDDVYVGHITYLKLDEEDTIQEGVTIEVPLFGETVSEIAVKVRVLHSIGFFADVEFLDHADLFDDEGTQIGQICWPSGGKVTPIGEDHDHADEDEDDSPTVTITAVKPTLH